MMRLSEAASVVKGKLLGRDADFNGVSTDTRTIKENNLYVALQGDNFDGHDFLQDAQDAGACAALVSSENACSLAQIKVQDTKRSLGLLAKQWRASLDCVLVGVTGSNGKTTVKEIIANIFAQVGDVCATQGNLNNDIGVPLSLLKITKQHRFAVIEMGANHVGEIAYLTDLAKPNVAVITNAMAAHLEGFKSVDNVAKAKGEIYSGLVDDGIAVVNADSDYTGLWDQLSGQYKTIHFGINNKAEFSVDVDAIQYGIDGSGVKTQFDITAENKQIPCELSLIGQHNVINALAAATVCRSVGVSWQAIQQGMTSMQAVQGRLQLVAGINQSCLIHDAYNANPDSMKAAIDVLLSFGNKKTYLVVGDMAELGEQALDLHQEVVRYAKAKGVDVLYAVGAMMTAAVSAFGKSGKGFENHQLLIDQLKMDLANDSLVLVKGSRFMQMEQIIDSIKVRK